DTARADTARADTERSNGTESSEGRSAALDDGNAEEANAHDEDALTILLAGHKNELTDSMLLVRVEEGEDHAKILSLPRDLWYDGRKLNQHYSDGGAEAMVEAVTDITGFAPDHYAVVDMKGFVRIIDHLGGITVTLDEPLSDDQIVMPDPESSLEFSAGTHEIDGTEALLIARSRATSSDFARSRRQSRIIEGLQRRISEISPSDLPALFDIVGTVTEYVDTDVSVPEAVGYFLKYGFVEDFERAGLSTDNVLVTDHSLYLPDERVPWRSDEDPAQFIDRRERASLPQDRRPYRGDKRDRADSLAMRDAERLSQVYDGRLRELEESPPDEPEEVDEAMNQAEEGETGAAGGEEESAGADDTDAPGDTDEAGTNDTDAAGDTDEAGTNDTDAPGDTDPAGADDTDVAGNDPAGDPDGVGGDRVTSSESDRGRPGSDEPPRTPTELSPITISLKRRMVDSSGIDRILPARGFWILLPYDDDRDHIRWYAETFFTEGPPSEDAIEDRLGL
ncbi:MAG: LCP family protein, partial [Spirochaetota bacterium]